MRRAAALAAAAAALALPSATGAEPPRAGIVVPSAPPGTPLLQLGYQLYAGNCSSCHGSLGEGVAPRGATGSGDVEAAGPPLRGVGALAADFYLRTGYMPLATPQTQPRRSGVLFSPHELAALVAYVASLGRGPAVPHPRPGDVADGQRLFAEHCAGCHQIAAQGGYLTGAVAPPLAPDSATQIAEAVRVGPYLMPRFSERTINSRQLDAIVAYVRSLDRAPNPGGWGIGRVGPVPEGMVAWLIAGVALVGCCLVFGRRRAAR
jgi:ubiquinol-cytochrome c reductase cytochrome c subunit